MSDLYSPPNRRHRRFAALGALAIAGSVFVIGLQLLNSPDSNGLFGDASDVHRRTSLKDWYPKINLASPYSAHRGDIEPALNEKKKRRELSTYWTKPTGEVRCRTRAVRGPQDIPADVTFQNTIIAGYPGADKRVILRQMELLSRLSGRDAWDFQFLGMTRQPFIKTNYPHHEGIWGWQDHGDQVMLVVRNIRHTIDEYHDILSDIDYAKTWREATDKIPRLYKGSIIEDSYVRWRDERTMDEIGWYGWLIDYWMEGGVLRDYFDHKLTTQEHWAKLRKPETYTYGELQWDVNNCETDPVLPVVYDANCDPTNTADCMAKVVIGAERLMDPATGASEARKIAMLMNQTEGIKDWLLDEPGWDCMYDLVIGLNTEGTGPNNTEGYDDYRVRGGVADRKHVVSTRHLNKMVQQLTRLILKYGAFDPETNIDWANSPQAQYLIEILGVHRADLEAELATTNVEQVWAHPPKPNWVVFPKCGAGTEGRRVWDYNYPHEYSGETLDMFPDVV